MPPKPTKRKTPAAQTAGAQSANPTKTNERINVMNSIAVSKNEPALYFSLNDFQLRVIIREGEPWFVAADVCAALELGNVTNALKRLDEDELALISIKGFARGNDLVNLVSEPGLYSLILGSRKPEARQFKRWVTHDVLPSIRKTGSYSLKRQVPFDRQLARCQSLVLQIVRCEDVFGRHALVQLAKVAYAEIGQQLPDVALLPVLVSANNNQPSLDLVGGAS